MSAHPQCPYIHPTTAIQTPLTPSIVGLGFRVVKMSFTQTLLFGRALHDALTA